MSEPVSTTHLGRQKIATPARVAVVGATGLVGRTMLRVLEDRYFPVRTVKAVASERSQGVALPFAGNHISVESLDDDSFNGIDIALFSAGSSVSRIWAPVAVRSGTAVVDNSSAWRMDPDVPLIVPEVNAADIVRHSGIIANPNCSTIQLVVALKPLVDAFGIKRAIVSTYQSITGAGQSAVDQFEAELKGEKPQERVFRRRAAHNYLFHSFPDGSSETEEELKMLRETDKILGVSGFPLSVTCVRVPALGAHGESVNVTLNEAATVHDVRECLASAPGITLMDDPAGDVYPDVAVATNSDQVFVGRIRQDASEPDSFNFWIVADNLRKGAATNAVQIAELLTARQTV